MGAPPTSFLSTVSEFARAALDKELFQKHGSTYRVTVDSPSGVQKLIEADGNTHGALNLFFYRFEPSGFFPQASANDRWHVRARCLMTAFSITETDGANIIPAGEIDLRVLGSVMQYLHEHPVMVDDARGIHLEVVPGNLSSEEINQIWASQHNVAYRPSLLYEFALMPVEPVVPAVSAGIVIEGGANATVSAHHSKRVTP
jgi:Pvc16 N-terminal domain